MKRIFLKKAAAFVTAAVCAFTVAAAIAPASVDAQAAKKKAKTKTCTVYKQEGGMTVNHGYLTIKSIKSSDKKIASAQKDKDLSSLGVIRYKKTGKVSVTAKYKGYGRTYTDVWKLNIKNGNSIFKKDIIQSTSNTYYSHYYISLKNTSKVNFSTAKIEYRFYDTDGTLVESNDDYLFDLNAGTKAYTSSISVSNDLNVDISKTRITVTSLTRSQPDLTKTSRKLTKKQYKIKSKLVDRNGYKSLKLSITNKTKKSIDGSVYIIVRDPSGAVVSINRVLFYVGAEKTTTQFNSTLIQSDAWKNGGYRYSLAYSAISA